MGGQHEVVMLMSGSSPALCVFGRTCAGVWFGGIVLVRAQWTLWRDDPVEAAGALLRSAVCMGVAIALKLGIMQCPLEVRG